MGKQVRDKPPADAKKPTTKPKREFEINVFTAWCKACRTCVEFCPKDVLASDAEGKAVALEPEKCIGCMQCVLLCPDFAITVEEKNPPEDQDSRNA